MNWRKVSAILFAIPVLIGVVLAVCTTFPPSATEPELPPEPPASSALSASSFPIEVLGTNGTIWSYTVAVTNGSTADNLWFKVHNLSFEGKMSVRVNGSNWVTLTDTNVVYPDREYAQYGMGGISSTLRFHYTLGGEWTIANGTNTFEFRFNDNSESLTVGYRVLEFSPRAGTNWLIHPSQITTDDPSTWTPPSSNPTDINDGKDAWFNLTITERGTNIVAKCTDCHAWDGRDLKYFNYSAKSIIERSIFHSVPATRATNIASYILSLSVPYATNARPWNPPYQPGPGIDSTPINQWAAGMGLNWVQDSGTNGIYYIFTNGITTNALNLTNIVSAREVPLSIPFPDWNTWLPKIHPYDQDYTFFATNRFTQIYYTEIRPGISNRVGASAASYFNGRKNAWDSAGSINPSGQTWEWRRDQRHWRVVKVWEIMNEFAIQDYGLATDGIFTNMVNGAELNDRRWFHGEVFKLGPHVLNIPTLERDLDRFYWESAQWYQTQLVLNDGNRIGGSIVPIDWGYQHDLNISAWGNPGDFVTYDAMVLNVIKALEVGCNGLAMSRSTTHGFNPYKANVNNLEGKLKRPYMDSIDTNLRRAVTEAVGIRWIEVMESFTDTEFSAASRLEPSLENLLDELILWWGPTKLNVDSSLVTRLTNLKNYLFP